jgi:hypothetical protein
MPAERLTTTNRTSAIRRLDFIIDLQKQDFPPGGTGALLIKSIE